MQLGVGEEERAAITNCMDMREGQSLYDLTTMYAKLVMPTLEQRYAAPPPRLTPNSGVCFVHPIPLVAQDYSGKS